MAKTYRGGHQINRGVASEQRTVEEIRHAEESRGGIRGGRGAGVGMVFPSPAVVVGDSGCAESVRERSADLFGKTISIVTGAIHLLISTTS
jgi:hypothetical protein